MKLVKIGEYTWETGSFVKYFLIKSGIKAELRHLIHSAKDELGRITGKKDYMKGWDPQWALMVPEKDKKVAEYITGKLPEYNWCRINIKDEDIDITRDIIPQTWEIRPFKKPVKKKKNRKKK